MSDRIEAWLGFGKKFQIKHWRTSWRTRVLTGNGLNAARCLICRAAFGRLLIKVKDSKPGCARKGQGFEGFVVRGS